MTAFLLGGSEQWGPLLTGQNSSLYIDRGLFPDTIVCLRNSQVCYYLADNENFLAISIEELGNDTDAGPIYAFERNPAAPTDDR